LRSDYADLAATMVNGGNSVLELSRSFLESVCFTILKDRGKDPSSDKTGPLVRETLAALGLQNTRGASKFDKILSAYNGLTDALNDARNEVGSAAHGKDGFLDALSDNQRRVYVLAADSVIHLLLAALDGQAPDLRYTREPYKRFQHHNSVIDATVYCSASVEGEGSETMICVAFQVGELDLVEVNVSPSEFLFAHDRDAYVELLKAAGDAPPVEDEQPS
jgi:hypothetical protein